MNKENLMQESSKLFDPNQYQRNIFDPISYGFNVTVPGRSSRATREKIDCLVAQKSGGNSFNYYLRLSDKTIEYVKSHIATCDLENSDLFVSVAYDDRTRRFAIYKDANTDRSALRKLICSSTSQTIPDQLSVGSFLDENARESVLKNKRIVRLKTHSLYDNAIILIPE